MACCARSVHGDAVPSVERREAPVPTRRIMAVTLLIIVGSKPVFGLVKLWSSRKLAEPNTGSIATGAAQIGAVVF
jgi:hypothetical protein